MGIAVLAGVLAIGMYLIVRVRRWRQELDEEESTGEGEQERFYQLYQEGELSQEEYERICRKLGKMEKPVSDEEKGSY